MAQSRFQHPVAADVESLLERCLSGDTAAFDLLAGIYGDLPPEEMDGARKRIDADPELTEELRRIKEAIRRDRSAIPLQLPPRGAERAQTATGEDQSAWSRQPPPREEAEEGESAGRSRRRCFFHPAWPVAASVLFVFAALIHISPRRDFWLAAGSAPGPSPKTAVRKHPRPSQSPSRRLPPATAAPIPAETPGGSTGGIPPGQRPAPLPAPASTNGIPASASVAASPVPATAAPEAGPTQSPPPIPPGVILDEKDLEQLLGREDGLWDGATRIVDMTGGIEPPGILNMPAAIDKEKLLQNLIFLVGLHMGEKEFADARIAIGLLGRYDQTRADELESSLLEMEKGAAPADDTESLDSVEPASPTTPRGKYAPTGDTEVSPAVSAALTEKTEQTRIPAGQAVIVFEDQEAIQEPPPDPQPAARENASQAEDDTPFPANTPAPGTDVQTLDMPEASLPVGTASTENEVAHGPPDQFESGRQIDAVPGDADEIRGFPVPGTLGPSLPWPPPLYLAPSPSPAEQAAGIIQEEREPSPPLPENIITAGDSATGGKQPFTVDPYYRGD